MKKCLFCGEEIQDEAVVCRFCNRSLKPKKKNLWVIFGVPAGIVIIIFIILAIVAAKQPALPTVPPLPPDYGYSNPVCVYQGSLAIATISSRQLAVTFSPRAKVEGSWKLLGGCNYVSFCVFDELNFYKWKAGNNCEVIHQDNRATSGTFEFTSTGGNYYFVFKNEAVLLQGNCELIIYKRDWGSN